MTIICVIMNDDYYPLADSSDKCTLCIMDTK